MPNPRQIRRPKGVISSYNINSLHKRNPWVIACWSAIFPGFGHISIGKYLKGFLLVIWELVINHFAKVNTAILYGFTGKFDLCKEVLDKRWFLLYVGVFVFAIWDSYRSTIETNKLSILADAENSEILPVKISSFDINYFHKRNPWVSLSWSFIMPGTGQLYNYRLPLGFFVLIWWILISYQSHIAEAIFYSLTGNTVFAAQTTDPQWLLFMPSIFGFAAYNSYVSTVEYNKLFTSEQNKYLADNYQDSSFAMPI